MAVGQPVQGIPAQGLPAMSPSADGSVPARGGMQAYVAHNPSMGVASSSGLNLLPLSPSGVRVLVFPQLIGMSKVCSSICAMTCSTVRQILRGSKSSSFGF